MSSALETYNSSVKSERRRRAALPGQRTKRGAAGAKRLTGRILAADIPQVPVVRAVPRAQCRIEIICNPDMLAEGLLYHVVFLFSTTKPRTLGRLR